MLLILFRVKDFYFKEVRLFQKGLSYNSSPMNLNIHARRGSLPIESMNSGSHCKVLFIIKQKMTSHKSQTNHIIGHLRQLKRIAKIRGLFRKIKTLAKIIQFLVS